MLTFIPAEAPRRSLSPSESVLMIADAMNSGDLSECNRTLFERLRDGSVTAYVHLIDGNRFYRVPLDYWSAGDFWDLRISDRLFAWPADNIPAQLENAPVVLDGDSVRAALTSIRRAVPKLPPVPPAELRRWLEQRSDLEFVDINRDLWPAAQKAFSGFNVPRSRVRDVVSDLSGPRKAGRKQQCAKK